MVGLLTLYSNHQNQVKRLRRLLELQQRPDEPGKPAMRRRRYIDTAELSELVALYEAGATVYELAEQFGIHRDRVSRLLEEAGVPRRYHHTVEVDLERAALLQRQGFTLQQIADRLGVGRSALVVARRRTRS